MCALNLASYLNRKTGVGVSLPCMFAQHSQHPLLSCYSLGRRQGSTSEFPPCRTVFYIHVTQTELNTVSSAVTQYQHIPQAPAVLKECSNKLGNTRTAKMRFKVWWIYEADINKKYICHVDHESLFLPHFKTCWIVTVQLIMLPHQILFDLGSLYTQPQLKP